MRTLLRHKTTNLYLQSLDKWTADPELAFDFRFKDRAVNYIEMWHLEEVEVAFPLEPTQTLPAGPEHTTPAEYLPV